MYRKLTHTDSYLHYNSFHHSSIKNSACKTLIIRAKTICEVDNIEGELEHLRSVLKMNDYPEKFIDNAMKPRQHLQETRTKDCISVFCQFIVYLFSFI